MKKDDVQASRLIKAYHSRRKLLREYNEAATTREEALVFGVLATSEKSDLGTEVPRLGPEALLTIHEENTFWSSTPQHLYLTSTPPQPLAGGVARCEYLR